MKIKFINGLVLLFLCILIAVSSSQAQDPPAANKPGYPHRPLILPLNCDQELAKWSKKKEHGYFFGSYTNDRVDPEIDKLVNSGWADVYKTDLFSSALIDSKDLFPVHFDALGMIYPDISTLEEIGIKFEPSGKYKTRKAPRAKGRFLEYTSRLINCTNCAKKYNGQHVSYLTTSSLLLIANDPSNKKLLDSYIIAEDTPKSIHHFIDASRKIANHTIGYNFNSTSDDRAKKYASLDVKKTFQTTYGNTRSKEVARELAQVVNEKKYKRVLFFFAGYNMPYVMQAIQAEYLRDYTSLVMQDSSTLIVPCIWPSGGMFKKQRNWLKNHNMCAGGNWSFFKLKAFYVGYGFRQLVANLEEELALNEDHDIEMMAFAHSGGNAILATSLTDGSALKTPPKRKNYSIERAFTPSDYYYFDINDQYKGTKLPKNQNPREYFLDYKFSAQLVDMIEMSGKIDRLPENFAIFHSAPAISSKYIASLQPSLRQYRLFGSVNSRDPQLRKKKVLWVREEKRVRKFGSTTLGYKGPLKYAYEDNKQGYYRTKDLKMETHNILLYMKNPHYFKLFSEFMNSDCSTSEIEIITCESGICKDN